ncbi:hypothetical protein F5X99DRAFT_396960 [Biscogniauxia marginata]|nr:hypothetical protein F5X99DRAFT_396960 [Biscogniauxia marginata]
MSNSPTSNDDFNNQWDQAQDTYNRTATTISVGWIVGIVIIILFVIGFGVAACYIYRRNQKRRRAREQLEQKHDNPVYDNQEPEGYTQTQSSPQAGPWAQQSEIPGSAVPPRFEIPNTEVLCKEALNNEVPRSSLYDPPRSELNGAEGRRSELPG